MPRKHSGQSLTLLVVAIAFCNTIKLIQRNIVTIIIAFRVATAFNGTSSMVSMKDGFFFLVAELNGRDSRGSIDSQEGYGRTTMHIRLSF